MNRQPWTQPITKHATPNWPCPICGVGTIALVRGSVKYEETVTSKSLHDHDAWEPEWIEYVFTAWGKCAHRGCAQLFSISGQGDVTIVQDDVGGYDYENFFYPKQCSPMPNIIEIPSELPADLSSSLQQAFGLFWGHSAACAGRIRVGIELLMDFLKIQRKKKSNNGKFFTLTLHQRLELFKTQQPAVGSQLIALKWLGNTGSHFSSVTKKDLLDAFEIMEYALDEIVGNRSQRIDKLAKDLVKKHRRKRR